MIVDAHTHVFPADVIGARETLLRDEPLFAELYGAPGARMATAADLLQAMDEAGVDHAVIAGFAWRDLDRCRRHNDALLEASVTSRGRLTAFCAAPSAAPELTRREIERCARNGARGLGELRLDLLHQAQSPDRSAYAAATAPDPEASPSRATDLPVGRARPPSLIDLESNATPGRGRQIEALAEAAVAHGLPVLLHASEPVGHPYPGKGGGSLGAIWTFMAAFPRMTVVLAHLGGGLPFYAHMPEVQAAFGRAYVDTAAVPWLYRSAAYRAVIDLIGVDRILFGSDFPLRHPARDLALLSETDLTTAERSAVLGGNAARLLDLPVGPASPEAGPDAPARL